MNIRKITPAFSILLLILSAPVFADDFRQAVDKAAVAFGEAARKGDAAAMGALYATEAIAFPPNGEMLTGRDAIQSFWAETLKSGVTDIPLEVVSTESDGNLGVEVGKYTIVGSEKKVLDRGKYVVVWKKVAGQWKLYRDIWNTSMPAAPAAQ